MKLIWKVYGEFWFTWWCKIVINSSWNLVDTTHLSTHTLWYTTHTLYISVRFLFRFKAQSGKILDWQRLDFLSTRLAMCLWWSIEGYHIRMCIYFPAQPTKHCPWWWQHYFLWVVSSKSADYEYINWFVFVFYVVVVEWGFANY